MVRGFRRGAGSVQGSWLVSGVVTGACLVVAMAGQAAADREPTPPTPWPYTRPQPSLRSLASTVWLVRRVTPRGPS